MGKTKAELQAEIDELKAATEDFPATSSEEPDEEIQKVKIIEDTPEEPKPFDIRDHIHGGPKTSNKTNVRRLSL